VLLLLRLIVVAVTFHSLALIFIRVVVVGYLCVWMLVYCGPSVFVCASEWATINKTAHTHTFTLAYLWANIANWLWAANTKIICFLTALLSLSRCVCIGFVSRASYILCMQVKKKRKNKSKSKDKHVYKLSSTHTHSHIHTHSARQRVRETRSWFSCDICSVAGSMLLTLSNTCLRIINHSQLFLHVCICCC